MYPTCSPKSLHQSLPASTSWSAGQLLSTHSPRHHSTPQHSIVHQCATGHLTPPGQFWWFKVTPLSVHLQQLHARTLLYHSSSLSNQSPLHQPPPPQPIRPRAANSGCLTLLLGLLTLPAGPWTPASSGGHPVALILTKPSPTPRPSHFHLDYPPPGQVLIGILPPPWFCYPPMQLPSGQEGACCPQGDDCNLCDKYSRRAKAPQRHDVHSQPVLN